VRISGALVTSTKCRDPFGYAQGRLFVGSFALRRIHCLRMTRGWGSAWLRPCPDTHRASGSVHSLTLTSQKTRR
jgi:hypothetical protein